MIQFFYITSVSCVKISILLFYKRTFHTQSRHFIRCIYAALATVVLWTLAFSIVTLLQVWPIAAFWDASIPIQWKIHSTKMYLWLSVTDIILDIVTLVLPLPMIGRLKMTTKNRWALAGVFAVGSFAAVAGIVRLFYALRFRHHGSDITYEMYRLAIWSCIEPSMGIISACLPLLHPFFKRHAPEAIVGANTVPYGLLRAETEDIYHDPRGMSMYLDEVDKYHERVIE